MEASPKLLLYKREQLERQSILSERLALQLPRMSDMRQMYKLVITAQLP